MSSRLDVLFGGRTKASILEVLASRPGQSFHLRGLAHAAGIDSGNTSRALKPLVDVGLILAKLDGPGMRYSLNDRSSLTRPLRELIAAANAFTSELKAVARELDARYAAIFGSVASGTDDEQSDVDVLVVGPRSALAVQAAFKPLSRRSGRAINALAVTPAEFLAHLVARGEFWAALARGKRIDLVGEWGDVAHTVGASN